jgi:site-specific DNA recombinase
MKAELYTRVSSRDQETGYSLDSQVKLLTEYAKAKNFDVSRVYRISETASKFLVRKTLAEMLSHALKHDVDIILCEKIDRLTRNLKDAAIIDDWVHEKDGREVHFVKEGFILNKNTKAHESLVWDMKVAIARFYTNNLSEEVKKGYAEKLAQGGRPGRAPLGYRSQDDNGRKKNVIDDRTAPFVKRLLENYATGNYSMKVLTRMAYEDGLRSRTGHQLGISQIEMLLKQPFYYGAIKWNGKIYDFSVHEPLISKETFDKIQDVRMGKKAPKYQRHHFQFRKMLQCGRCEGTVTAELKKGKYIYYHCNHYYECPQTGVTREDRIEEQLISAFKFFESITPKEAEKLRLKIKQNHSVEAAYKESTIQKLNERYSILQHRLDTLYDDRLDEKITNEFWERKNKEITDEQSELQEQLSRLKNEEARYFEIWISILDLAFRSREIYERSSPQEKRTLLRHIFSNLVLTDGNVAHTFKTPVQKLVSRVQQRIDEEKSFATPRYQVITGINGQEKIFSPVFELERAQ